MKQEDKEIAERIHYPRCWDTCAYPTLATALWEMVDMPINKKCPTCGLPQNEGDVIFI
jgi:hypothetical protein